MKTHMLHNFKILLSLVRKTCHIGMDCTKAGGENKQNDQEFKCQSSMDVFSYNQQIKIQRKRKMQGLENLLRFIDLHETRLE